MHGVAVVKQDRGPAGQGGEEPVPHHPAAGGDVEDLVFPLEIAMDDQFLQVVDQDSTRALDHALGLAGGAGGKHDEHRMIEGQLLEFHREVIILGQKILEVDRVGNAADVRLFLRVRHDDDLFERGNPLGDLGGIGHGVEILALVEITVDGDQGLGLYLAEPVKGRGRTDVGGAG
jgi:hypothetical protein